MLMPHGCGGPLSPAPSCSGLAAPGPPGSRWGRPLPGGQAGYQAEMGSLPHSHKKGCKKLAAAHATCRAWLAPHSRNNLSQGCPDWRHRGQALRVPARSSGAGTGARAPLLAQPGPSSSQNRDRQCPHGGPRCRPGHGRGCQRSKQLVGSREGSRARKPQEGGRDTAAGLGGQENEEWGAPAEPAGRRADRGQWLSKTQQAGSQAGGPEGTAEGWPGQGRDDVTQAVRVASLGPPAHRGAP